MDQFTIHLRNALSRFNQKTIKAVLLEARSFTRLKKACRQMGLPVSDDTAQQIRILIAAIEADGEDRFLSQWAISLDGENHTDFLQSLVHNANGQEDAHSIHIRPVSPERAPEREIKYVQQRYADTSSQRFMPKMSPPLPGKAPFSPIEDKQDPPLLWPDAERRAGGERRSGADRRASVDTVYKNRRFGGDRRSQQARRKVSAKG